MGFNSGFKGLIVLKFSPILQTLFYVISDMLEAMMYAMYIVMFCINYISLNTRETGRLKVYFYHISLYVRLGRKIMCITVRFVVGQFVFNETKILLPIFKAGLTTIVIKFNP